MLCISQPGVSFPSNGGSITPTPKKVICYLIFSITNNRFEFQNDLLEIIRTGLIRDFVVYQCVKEIENFEQ